MTQTIGELPESVYSEIRDACEAGDADAKRREYESAIGHYSRAWQLIPDPKNAWNASTWILGAIADACYLGGFLTSAEDALQYAMTCPNGIGNPFLHLRYGQVSLDKGDEALAADELMRAYMGAGVEIFANEDDRYLAFLKMHATI
ncbi:hypothetical protein [Paraburkholderia megapolitana]|uniref:Tetratricopeptide repeat-containing protein n=1 Tax=Paraburkholderia megapolitana TaxID=420953 RepID=A0A1I3W0N7_9BURK|nr:hypothetical protein [Paraburkholderia megapolitana]SFK00763.1 hypothetical protein SAMN05192543_11569 [Paraburkholderia megapolitana]